MAHIDEFVDLLSTEARLYPVSHDGQELPAIVLQLSAAANAATELQRDAALPPHLKPQVAAFVDALQTALRHLQSIR